MGRPKKTLGEVLKDKTFRADRHAPLLASATRPVTAPTRPADLTGPAAELWDTITTTFRDTIGETDAVALHALCCWWDHWKRIETWLRAAIPGTTEHGRLLRALATATKGFSTFSIRFGLSPIDRERLPPPHTADPGDATEDKFFPRVAR